MFTGIVEDIGTLAEVKATAGGFRMRIASPLARETTSGDSLAVAGVCLTVLVSHHGEVHVDVGPETARVSTLGSAARGRRVNLERPLRVDGRLGGHFVQGHVDAMAIVDDVRVDGESHWLTIRYPSDLAPFLIRKGSVAVDGVSLTVAGLDGQQFDVQIIPFTWSHTTLSSLKRGDKVNLECDMLGKYAVRAAELRAAREP